MIGAYVVLGLLGLLAIGLVWWAIAGEVAERRAARAAARSVISEPYSDHRAVGGAFAIREDSEGRSDVDVD